MSRKEIIGICRICGQNKKLTFEHVPPETTFNDSAVKIAGEQVLRLMADGRKMPWDYKKEYGLIQQRGRGGYK